MSRSMNMLRTRRRDNNVKPNRRLDRKSSRGMIYENEELRLRTININAEIERGQYDIKKLKRENEMLKKEIWCLRDEYDKLDKLLKQKEYDFSSSSSTGSSSDSESCSSCSEESEEVETSQNLENVQKTNMKNLKTEFDHLSVVPEENSTENSDRTSVPNENWNLDNDIIKPDQSYPEKTVRQNFFSPIKDKLTADEFYEPPKDNFYQNIPKIEEMTINKTTPDLIVKTDNQDFTPPSRSTFSNGGNLEELLNDIETISQDILKITNEQTNENQKPYKSELSVVLMPNPMPLLGFEKYNNLQKSLEQLHSKSAEKLPDETSTNPRPNSENNPFLFRTVSDTSSEFYGRYNPENLDKQPSGSKTNLLELTSSDLISSENEENLKFQPKTPETEKKTTKSSLRRKVSIHFKGKRDKKVEKTPSIESRKSITDPDTKTPTSSDSKVGKKVEKQRKSVSASPDRKHVHVKDEKRHKKRKKGRRGTTSSVDRGHRERSFSVCTDKSLEHRFNGFCEEFGGMHSDRERTNSMSSCESVKTRKMSNVSNIPLNGKVPWCGCWGNGCI